MTTRSATKGAGRPVQSEVRGSQLDGRQPPTLPRGTPQPLRRMAEQIFEQNPHLWHESQVEPVLRLVKIRVQLAELEKQLEEEGLVLETPRGSKVENPASAIFRANQNVALRLEKGLGIVFSARGASVKEAEKVIPAQPNFIHPKPGDPKSAVFNRPLRLA